MNGPYGGPLPPEAPGGPPPGGPPPGGPPQGGPPQGYYQQPYYYQQPPQKSKMGAGAIVAVFVGVLVAFAVVAGVFVFLNQPPPPVTPCTAGQPCAPIPSLPPVASSPVPIATPRPPASPGATLTPGATAAPPGASLPPIPTPVSDSPPVLSGTLYTDTSLGYAFEYDADTFTLADHGDGFAVFNGTFFDAQVWVDAKTADTAPKKLIESELADADRFLIARVPDPDSYDALLGPGIGYVTGEGSVWSGTLTSRDGTPLAPGGVTVVSATDGRITVAVVVIVGTPDAFQGGETQQHSVRSAADDILKTFLWSVP